MDSQYNNIGLRTFDSIIFKVGSTYYARKSDGSLISSGTTAETVIQAAWDLKGSIYHAAANYDLSSAGLTLSADTHLEFAKGAKIRVPNNTVITAVTASDVSKNVSINGLWVDEQTSYTKKYTGLKLTSTSGTGIYFCNFTNCYIYKPDVGVELETTTADGFVNGNRFDGVIVHGPKTAAWLFDYFTNGDIASNGFYNCQVQMDSDTVVGFKNIASANNLFFNCNVWDAQATATEWSIAAPAKSTVIIGGNAGYSGAFIDLGRNTTVIGPYKGVGPYHTNRPDTAKQGAWYGSATATGEGLLGGRVVAIAVGTGTSSLSVDGSGVGRTYDTAATINSLAGNRTDANALTRGNHAYFKTNITTGSNIADTRIFAGLVADNGAPTSAADPLNAKSGVALWYDSAVNANWRMLHNDSSGASVSGDTTLAVNTATNYTVEIFSDIDDTKFRFVFNGTNTDISTDIPASSTTLAYWLYIENTTGASRTLRAYYVIIRTDK